MSQWGNAHTSQPSLSAASSITPPSTLLSNAPTQVTPAWVATVPTQATTAQSYAHSAHPQTILGHTNPPPAYPLLVPTATSERTSSSMSPGHQTTTAQKPYMPVPSTPEALSSPAPSATSWPALYSRLWMQQHIPHP